MMTPKKRAYVKERIKDPTASDTEIVRRAGYSPTIASQYASVLKRDKDVQDRIQQLGEVGLDALEEVAKNGRVEIAKVQAGKALVETAYGKPKDNPTNKFGDITINVNKIGNNVLESIGGVSGKRRQLDTHSS